MPRYEELLAHLGGARESLLLARQSLRAASAGWDEQTEPIARSQRDVDFPVRTTALVSSGAAPQSETGLILANLTRGFGEVTTALSDSGIGRRATEARLAEAQEHLVQAREHLAVAEGVTTTDHDRDRTHAVVYLRDATAEIHRTVTAAAVHQVDLSMASAQAYLSGPVGESMKGARSLAYGAAARLDDAHVNQRGPLTQLSGAKLQLDRAGERLEVVQTDVERSLADLTKDLRDNQAPTSPRAAAAVERARHDRPPEPTSRSAMVKR